VFNNTDALNDGGDESYLNLEFLLPGASTINVIIITRYIRAAEITTLVAVEVILFKVITYDDNLSFLTSIKWTSNLAVSRYRFLLIIHAKREAYP
jgi:hypothetical protein